MVTLNIMIPNGKLKVTGGARNSTMTGWYVIEKVESDGRGTTWNGYDCSGSPIARNYVSVPYVTPVVKETPVVQPPLVREVFDVKVYPNPTVTDFKILVISSNNTDPIQVRLIDMSGVVRAVSTNPMKGIFTMGANLTGGTYLAEVTQGKNKQVLKVIKLN